MEQAVFAKVALLPIERKTGAKPVVESTLETVDIGSKDRRVVYRARDHFEAPNWSRDGQGTINVPSWSPDSRKVAFVSYRLVEP